MTLPAERAPAIWAPAEVEVRRTPLARLRDWHVDFLRLHHGRLVHRASAATGELLASIFWTALGGLMLAFPILVAAAAIKVLSCIC